MHRNLHAGLGGRIGVEAFGLAQVDDLRRIGWDVWTKMVPAFLVGAELAQSGPIQREADRLENLIARELSGESRPPSKQNHGLYRNHLPNDLRWDSIG